MDKYKKAVGQTLGCGVLLLVVSVRCLGAEDDLYFDPSLLGLSREDEAHSIDLSHFSKRGGQLPGEYLVDIALNGEVVSQRKVQFLSDVASPGKLFACLTSSELAAWGVALEQSTAAIVAAEKSQCLVGNSIAVLVPGATEKLEMDKLLLSISVPQAQMLQGNWLRTPPGRWDYGFSAFLLNYDVNGVSQSNDGQRYDSRFLALNAGLNLYGWRLRHDTTLQQSKGRPSQWNALNSYAQHSYSALQGGELTLGQTSTDGALFESVPYTGAQAVSDDGMLVSSLAEFAPVIRGMATSPSVVTVRQNGSVIYQQNVQAGPYELRDLPQGAGNSDLQVEVRGTDGKTERFTQASASVPLLLRAGRLRYSLAAGQYRQTQDSDGPTPGFVQGTLGWGLDSGTTLYGGSQLASNYRSAMIGVGQYVPLIGAFSLDATQAQSQFSSSRSRLGTQNGQSYRFNYARGFEQTNTTLNIVGYRYATQGFYSFNDVQQQQRTFKNPLGQLYFSDSSNYHLRSRFQVALFQSLGDYGSLALSGSRDNYWSTNRSGCAWQAGYSTSLSGVSLSLTAGINQTPSSKDSQRMFGLSLSVPLSRLVGGSTNTSATFMSNVNDSRIQNQAGISGSLLMHNNLTYGVSQGVGNQGQGYSGNANTNYTGSYGSVGLGYSYQQKGRQINYSARGGVVASEHGLVFSQPLSFTGANALVKAPDAGGLGVNSGSNVRTNGRGYAVVPNLIPYQSNRLSLDVNDLAADVELIATDKRVVPTRGSIVLASFDTYVGKKALVSLSHHGKPVPFGASVLLQTNDSMQSGIVAEGGQAYIIGSADSGTLNVNWGTRPDQQCVAHYQLPNNGNAIHQVSAICE